MFTQMGNIPRLTPIIMHLKDHALDIPPRAAPDVTRVSGPLPTLLTLLSIIILHVYLLMPTLRAQFIKGGRVLRIIGMLRPSSLEPTLLTLKNSLQQEEI